MFRFLLITACLAVPVLSNSAGAPTAICKNGLTPEHHVEPQSSAVPYSFSGANGVRAGDKIKIELGGDQFLGFAAQAHNTRGQPIGQFNIVESNKSQLLTCSNAGDTITHKLIPRDNPISRIEFEWTAPKDYKGKVKFVGTVAKDGGTYWIRKVVKEVDVQ